MSGRGRLVVVLALVVAISAIPVAIYAFSMQSGRYQAMAIQLGQGFVILDTATGLFWVYDRTDPRRGFVLSQTVPPVDFLYRVLPPQWLDRPPEKADADERVPGTGGRIIPQAGYR